MLLLAETTTTISTIASYATSLPEPVELMLFGAAIATVAFLLRASPVHRPKMGNEKAAAEKA